MDQMEFIQHTRNWCKGEIFLRQRGWNIRGGDCYRLHPFDWDRLLPFLGRRLGASTWIESAFAGSFSSVSG